MATKKKTYTTTSTLEVETKPLPQVSGFLVYRCQQVVKTHRRKPRESIWEGICNAKNTPSPGNLRPKQKEGEGWILTTQVGIDAVARYGWCSNIKRGKKSKKSKYYPLYDEATETPFSDLDKREDLIPIRIGDGASMLFDHKGEALPVAQHCGYIHWRVDNGHYDLDKAMEILGARGDVHDLGRDYIPYYNSESGRDETLYFIWAPDVTTYRRAWKWCLESKTNYPSTNFPYAVEALDLWGLEKGGAKKPSRYYE